MMGCICNLETAGQNYDGTTYGGVWNWAGNDPAPNTSHPLRSPNADTTAQTGYNAGNNTTPQRRTYLNPTTEGNQRNLYGQGKPMAKDSSGNGANWDTGLTSQAQNGNQSNVVSRLSFEGTVTATDMGRATDAREKGRVGIFGTDLSYAGSHGRVTSETIGRDLNPLGRGDGMAYVAGWMNLGTIYPMLPKTISKQGQGNSVNNDIGIGYQPEDLNSTYQTYCKSDGSRHYSKVQKCTIHNTGKKSAKCSEAHKALLQSLEKCHAEADQTIKTIESQCAALAQLIRQIEALEQQIIDQQEVVFKAQQACNQARESCNQQRSRSEKTCRDQYESCPRNIDPSGCLAKYLACLINARGQYEICMQAANVICEQAKMEEEKLKGLEEQLRKLEFDLSSAEARVFSFGEGYWAAIAQCCAKAEMEISKLLQSPEYKDEGCQFETGPDVNRSLPFFPELIEPAQPMPAQPLGTGDHIKILKPCCS